MIRVFEVGGSVRDRFLGVASKDRDFAVEAPSWEAMREHVHGLASKVFLEKPEYLTIRALVGNEARDYVLARKDGAYSDARRPDFVTPGTIADDLRRRDFTVNAIAVDEATGEVLDPYDGQADIKTRTLRCVGGAQERLSEDALRAVRAIRFMVTKGFQPDEDLRNHLKVHGGYWATQLDFVSTDRIREELERCFKHDTTRTLVVLSEVHVAFTYAFFGRRPGGSHIWLQPTTAAR